MVSRVKKLVAVAQRRERGGKFASWCLLGVVGTGRYLAIQSIIVAVWMGLNVAAVAWRFDPYPFILLNLVFCAQAAYAAPLICLPSIANPTATGSRWARTATGPNAFTQTPTSFPESWPRYGSPSARRLPGTTYAVNCNGLTTGCPPRLVHNPDRTTNIAQAGHDDRADSVRETTLFGDSPLMRLLVATSQLC
jgi:hypothetical protein